MRRQRDKRLLPATPLRGSRLKADSGLAITNRGFTLTEIMLTLAILSIIFGAIYMIFRGATMTYVKGRTTGALYEDARMVSEMLQRDIGSMVIAPKGDLPLGIDLSETHIKQGSTADEFFFIRSQPRNEASDVAEIGYWLKGSDSTLRRHFDGNPDYSLATFYSDDEIASNVSDVQFEYDDGTAWRTSWKTGEGGISSRALPKAVKVKFTIRGKAFETLVDVK